ncbi:hypothetical protein HK098_001303 [Nowakowskiella sp. JEL0407]|nr:hypothetical protein HK098_001303 [Nowakowskiella sp. JEL0407]
MFIKSFLALLILALSTSALPAPKSIAVSTNDFAPHNCMADIISRSHRLKRRAEASFGYEGENGPLFWADLDPKNALCRSGQFQSPINFEGERFRAGSNETFGLSWKNTIPDAEFLNEGVTAKMILGTPKESTLDFGGKSFTLEQFHFHTPSEHHVDSRAFDAEIHFVHLSSAGQILVVAAMVSVDESSADNAFFSQLIPKLPIGPVETKNAVKDLDISSVISFFQTTQFNTYEGSLTTPPCTEGVRFFVSVNTIKIPKKQLDEMKKVVPFNARFTQKVSGRGKGESQEGFAEKVEQVNEKSTKRCKIKSEH